MGREVVTGYCWPQSVCTGEQVGLHLSSSGGRPVRVEVARVGARREVVFRSDHVATDEQEIPKDAASSGCGWPTALTVDVDPEWRSGYYEVVMELVVGEKTRRDYAFFVVRPPSGTRIVLALATNTWHAYNDFGGQNLYTGGTRVAMKRPMSAGYLCKPPGKGRRVTGTGAPDPQNAAHVGYIQINHLSGYAGSAGWPDWELPFIEWAEGQGFTIGVCTNADSGGTSRGIGGLQSVSVGRPRRVLVPRYARHGRSVHFAWRQCIVLLRQYLAVAGAYRG